MALLWGLSRLLALDEEELRSRVQWANEQTFAPFSGLYHSIAPVLGLACSSEVPAAPVIDDSSPLCNCPWAEQLSLSQDPPKVEVLEQNQQHFDSLVLSPASAILNTTFEKAEKELPLDLCEQNLRERQEAVPPEATEQKEDASAGEMRTAGSIVESNTTSSMVQLDRDSLSQILAHADNSTLQACSLVCHEWLEISSFARSGMILQKAPQVAALPTLLARFSKRKILRIKGLSDPPPADQAAGLCLDDVMMGVVARCCHSLQELHLDHCSALSDAGLALVLRACPELVDLRLDYCGGFTGVAFASLCCGIQKLEMNTCQSVTNEGLAAALSACSCLAEFGLMMRQGVASFAASLEGAAKLCTGLTKLKLHGCGVRDETLVRFAASCPALISVSISSEPGITDRGLADFFLGLAHLDTVNLTNNRLLTRVPPFPPTLKCLSLGCCLRARDPALRQVAQLTSLQELSFAFCPFLSDASVGEIIARRRSLRRLVLVADVSLTMETIRARIRSNSKVRLEVGHCRGIKEESVLRDAEGECVYVQCTRLKFM